ncbi:hypothetical protein PENSPDRAFT_293048 [Peniophora sp. CONT]|nr:hypothetical protein PENSPDRAFT_293048 [Peniophora sp. CONT]
MMVLVLMAPRVSSCLVKSSEDRDTELCFAEMILYDRVACYANSWGRFYTEIYKHNVQFPPAQPFCEDMKARACIVWWPSMSRLQRMIHRLGSDATPLLRRLEEEWTAFGKALGLDATTERTRHEKEALSRCAWRGCQYHREKPDDVTLLTCKGCGEVRYCGRDCQKSDWSKGGHKTRCRRLKPR